MSEADARAVAAWHYPDEYAFNDWSADPDDLADLLDPTGWGQRYLAVDSAAYGLAGFFAFAPEGAAVEMGLGLRPDLTGRGVGLSFVEAGLAYAEQRYGPSDVVLRVPSFNVRAITVYERAGFQAVEKYEQETNGGLHPFVLMVRTSPHTHR